MDTQSIIQLAAKQSCNGASMQSSAVLCLEDALRAYTLREFESAKRLAINSLGYSVGIFHADYKSAVSKQKTNEEQYFLETLQQARQLIIDMGHVIRTLDEESEHSDLWTNDGEYVPGQTFKQIDAAIKLF